MTRKADKGIQVERAPGARKAEMRIALVAAERAAHSAVRQALATQASGWVLESYFTAGEALRRINVSPPDIVLIDADLPAPGALGFARRLEAQARGARRELPFLILAATVDARAVRAALLTGAAGYLVKPGSARELVDAISRALEGIHTLSPAADELLVEELGRPGTRAGASTQLSAREWEIMVCLCRGQHNKQIAEAQHVSVRTVESHLANLRRKYEVHTRAELVRKFLGGGS